MEGHAVAVERTGTPETQDRTPFPSVWETDFAVTDCFRIGSRNCWLEGRGSYRAVLTKRSWRTNRRGRRFTLFMLFDGYLTRVMNPRSVTCIGMRGIGFA